MKKALFVFLVLCLALTLGACKKEETPSGGETMVEHIDIETLEKDSLNVSLEVPDSWEISSSSYLGTEIRRYGSKLSGNSDTFAESISVTSEEFSGDVELSEYVERNVENYKKTFTNFKIISEPSPVTVGEFEGIRVVFSYSTGALSVVVDQTFVLSDTNVYIIICNAARDSYEEFKDIFDTALKSFKIN